MNKTTRGMLAVLLGVIVGLQAVPATAQNIVLNGGSGDIFFLYNSAADVWNTVFRVKSTTVADGLTTPFNLTSDPAIWTGIQGNQVAANPGDNGDHLFETLTVSLNLTETLSVDGTDFYFADANGQFTNSVPTPDLGIRIRLREDEALMDGRAGETNIVDQFNNFTFTVNTALSTFNGTALEDTSAEVSLFANVLDTPVALFNTAEDELTGTFNSVWTHQHRNWGFSEYGEYAIVLDLQGVGGEYGDSDHQATINFNVIPEPSTFGLVILGLGFGGLVRKQRLRKLG